MQIIKCAVVSNDAIGKTDLPISYITNKFTSENIPTISNNYAVMVMVGGESYALGLFDASGQEGYKRLQSLSIHKQMFF